MRSSLARSDSVVPLDRVSLRALHSLKPSLGSRAMLRSNEGKPTPLRRWGAYCDRTKIAIINCAG